MLSKLIYLFCKKIANILRETGNTECLKKAIILEDAHSQASDLHLRKLNLKHSELIAIPKALDEEKVKNNNVIKSISLSYNYLISDVGAASIVNSLPASIREIGLVDCGIGDKGAAALLDWMKTSTNLLTICVERNNFSEKLKMEFRTFKKNHPHTMVVI